MGQATFSNSSSIKVQGGGTWSSNGTQNFSTSSGQYAIIVVQSASAGSITIGSATFTTGTTPLILYVSQNTTVQTVGGGTVTYNVAYTLFQNSP